MDKLKPQYFYIAHIYVSHPLILQKIITIAKLFMLEDSSAVITSTENTDGFFSLVVQSDSPVKDSTMSRFESQAYHLEGVLLIFSQSTINVEQTSDSYSPTYVYTAYFTLHFSWLSYHFGEGLLFRAKLKKYLDKMNGGVYYLRFFPNQMAVVIESLNGFDDLEVAGLRNLLTHQKLHLKTSFSNF